ncbi:TPA: hypothetical protein ACOEOW_003932 [Enterobacter hormaechei subsp. xiangfangensis]
MLPNISLATGLLLQNRQDIAIKQIPETVITALYEGDGNHFMMESVDMADIESTYFYDAPLIPQLNAIMFEAVTSTRARLSGTMRAFIRSLNQSLSGTGITAGNDTAGETDDGSTAMGGANIGRARKVQGLAVMPAIIPLSDGQTVTLVFHSPTGNTATIVATDTLVAFQFLLNKKDVTHVVSPANGRDVSLKVVTTALSNLIERNTAKFQKVQARQQAIKAEIANMQEEGDKLEGQQATLAEQGDALNAAIKTDSDILSELTDKANTQEDLNAELQIQIDNAKKKKADSDNAQIADRKNRSDALTAIQAKSGYKDTFVANWAFNQKISTADLVDLASRLDAVDVSDLKDLIMYKGQVSDLIDIPALKARNTVQKPESDPGPRTLYWYGLRARPAGVGAIPKDPAPVVTATPDEAANIPVVKTKGFDPSCYRYGAVGYTSPLDISDVAQYELWDFQLKQTPASFNTLLNDLIPLIKAYPGDENKFYLDYLANDAPKADDLPQSMKDAGGFQAIRQTMGSKITLTFIDFFKQVKKEFPVPDNTAGDESGKPAADAQDKTVLGEGDTVPLETIQTGAMMPTIAKGATNGDNPIWYTQSTLNDIVAAAKFKINGQPATNAPEFAEQRYQMVKAAMAAGFGLQRFKISGLQYIYVLRKDDDILTAQGAAKFTRASETPPVDKTPPTGDGDPAAAGNNGYVSVKPSSSEAGSIADQVSVLGISGGVAPGDLHVTLMYSKGSRINTQPEPERTYKARLTGEYKIIGNAPYEALVALLESSDLKARFDELSAAGGEHSYPEYLPHLSLKYSATQDDLDLIKAKGLSITSLTLSGETFKAIEDKPATTQPEQKQVAPDNELDSFSKAAYQFASLTGISEDGLSRWADNQNVSSDDLLEMANKLASNSSPDNIQLVKNAFDFGSPFPTLKEAEPVKQQVDTDAQKAIDYLKQVSQLDTSDIVEIRAERGNVRQAITALTSAGIYDENEDLVNAAAQRLSDLLAAVAQKGAA